MADVNDVDDALRVIDRVDHAPVADTDAPSNGFSFKLLHAWWTGSGCERTDLRNNARGHGGGEPIELLDRRRLDGDLVISHGLDACGARGGS